VSSHSPKPTPAPQTTVVGHGPPAKRRVRDHDQGGRGGYRHGYGEVCVLTRRRRLEAAQERLLLLLLLLQLQLLLGPRTLRRSRKELASSLPVPIQPCAGGAGADAGWGGGGWRATTCRPPPLAGEGACAGAPGAVAYNLLHLRILGRGLCPRIVVAVAGRRLIVVLRWQPPPPPAELAARRRRPSSSSFDDAQGGKTASAPRKPNPPHSSGDRVPHALG
jgi:hypothetical protein